MVEKSKFENNAVDVEKINFFPKTKQLRYLIVVLTLLSFANYT